jgi:Family of unknown function (DUF5678)
LLRHPLDRFRLCATLPLLLTILPMSENKLDLRKYVNKWVALTYPENKVVGTGDNATAAMQAAVQKGYHDPILYKVLPLDRFYIGNA